MARYLFDQEPTSYNNGSTLNLHWTPQDALLTAMPSCDEMEKHWGINTIDIRQNSAVKIHFNTGLEDGALERRLIDAGATPEDETFEVVRWIGPGVGFKGIVWSVACAEKNCVEFNIKVSKVNCATKEVTEIQKVEGLKAYEKVWAKQDWLAKPVGVEGGFILLVSLEFTKLPYADDEGNQYWGNDCNPVPCMGIDVHALTEDTCMRREIEGCGNAGDCCNSMPCWKCDQQCLGKSC